MAANKMQFQYEITANTSQAKKALADLDKALDRLNKQQKLDMGLSQELTEAADAARLLQRELNAAMDVKTGKLNVSELARGLAQAGSSVEQLSTKFLNAGAMGEAAFRGLAQSIVAADVPIKKMNKTLSDAMTTLKNTVKWEMSSTLVHGLEGAFSGAVSYAKNLNTSLTNIRIVTNQSIDDMVKFTKQANAAAKELSTTTKAYADASLIYYQQGDSQELAAKKAAITIKAANSSFETSAKEMSEYLTSVWNSYQVGADELERYVDIMANLGAKTATSLEEIATSMQKVAATANTVGVSMEQVSSIIATVSSVTRESAESIGTSYKTIFARIGDLKLGKVDEDGVGLGQVSSQLDAIGVKILDETGNLREMGDIIMDLGTKWQTMNQAQKTAVAQVVAGKRQYTQLMALFENWDMFQSNMNIAENSEGALQNMADIYAESWEAASARVQASMEGIFNKIINDQGIIKVTNTMANLIGGIENVIDGFGGLGGVITSIGSVATAVFKDKITVGVNDMVKSVTDFKKSFEGKKGKDIFTSFFGESSALRDYKKNLTELQNELKERQGWEGQSETDLFVNESIQKVLQAKQELLDIEGQLTTAERQRYQASIDNVNTSINDIKEQSMAYESQIKSIEKLIKQQSSLEAQQEALHRVDPEQTISTKQVQDEMRKKISSLTNAQMLSFNMKNILPNISQDSADIKQLLSRFKELNIIMTAAGEASEGLKDISKHLKTDTVDEQVKKLVSTLENFRTILKSIGANTDSIDKILGDLSTGTNDLEKVKQALKEAENATAQYEGAGKRAGAAAKVLAKDLGVSSAALDEITEQSKQSASMFRRLSASMKEAANSADEMLRGEGGPGSIGEKFSNLIQGLSSATSAFNTWSNVTANWDGMSLTETLGTVAELALDVATSGSLAGAAMTVAGAAIGGALGYIEKQQKDALEKVQKINEQVTETVEDIKQSNDLANEMMRTFEETENARKNGEIGTEEYLSIVDSVLEAIGAEQLKVQALMGDYDKLADSIRNANNERLAGNKTEARNNRILAYEGLETALKSYEGKGALKYEIGRNSIDVDDTELYTLPEDQRLFVKEYLTNMGFQWLDTEKGINLKWQGEETDLPLLFSEWERFESEDFIDDIGTIYSYLTEYMKQFDSYKMAYETERSLQAEEVLQGYQFNESTLKNQIAQGENLFQYIFNNVLTSLKLDPESISQYDTDIITAQIQDWIKYQADEIQIAFAQGWEAYNNGEEISTRTEQFTDKQFVQVWSSNKGKRSSARYYAQSDYDENIYEERINADQEQSIQDYANAVTAYKTATSGTANVPNLITSLLDSSIINIEDIITQQLGDIPEDINVVDYVSSSSAEIQYLLLEKIIEALGNSILGEDGLQTEALNLQEPLQNIIDQKMAEINYMFSNETGLYDLDVGQYLYNNPKFLEEIKQNYDKDQQKFDEYWIASLSDQERQIVTALTDNQTFLTDQVLNSNSWLYTLLKDVSLLYKDIEIVTTNLPVLERSDADYGRLSSVGSDYTEWNDSQKAIWNQYANLYTDDTDSMRNTALWGRMSEKDITAGIARIQQAAFNEKYSDINKQNINNAEYVADLAQLDEYVQVATSTSLEEIDNRYGVINSLLSSIQSMDLSKPITEMVVPAEKFQKIMGMSMDKFNQLPSISQKQLALLKAQSTQTAKQAEEIRATAYLWYDTTGKTLIERGDSEAIVLWAQLTEQIASSQADAAQSAQNVNAAYATLNDEAVAGIATQWERANKEAEKQQQIASILSSSVDTGIISNEEAAIIGITADEWARYSIEARAALAAKQTHKANRAIIQTLNNEKKALEDTISYFEQHKQAFDRYIQDDNAFERALNRWNLSGEQIKTFREARTQAINKVGKDNADEILTEMSIILNIDKKELESQIKQTVASSQDTISDIYNSLSFELQSQAQEAVEVWRQAFDSIAEARKILLEGGSLVDMLGDPEEFRRIYEQYKKSNPNASVEDFKNGVIRGEITIEDIQMPEITDDYMKQIYKEQGLDGLESSRTKDRWIQEQELRKAGITKDAEIEQALAMRYTNMFEKTTNLDSETIAEKVALIIAGDPGALEAYKELYSAVEEQKAILKGSEEIKYEGHEREETAIAVQKAADISNLVINANGAIQVDGETISSDTIGLTREDGKSSSFEEYTKLQEAITRAQDAKYDGKTGDSLEQADKDLLSAYGIDFSNVDTAATDCASALAACARAAYELAVQSANENNYYVNGDEQFEKGYTEEQGRNLYGTDWDSYKETLREEDGVFFTGEINEKITDLIRDAYDNLAELTNEAIDTPKNTEKLKKSEYELKMSEYGLDPEEVDEFGDYIAEASDEIEGLSKDLKDNGEAADEVAKDVMRYGNAVKLVKDNIKDWKKALSSDDLLLQSEAVQELDKAYSDMLDLDYDSLSKSFLSNTDNLELMEKAANGSTEAYDELLSKAHEDIKTNMILDKSKFDGPYNEVLSQMDAMSFKDMEVGASLDIGNFLSSLEQMVNAAGLTAEQATNLLSSMGIDAEIESHPVEETDQATFTGAIPIVRPIPVLASLPLFGKTLAGSVPMINYVPTPVQTTSPKKTTGFTLKVKSANKSSGGNFKHSNSGGSGGGRGGGGGSSSQKKDVKPMIRGRDEIQRYHKNNDTIDRLASSLDKIDKLKDRAYGKDHVAQLDAETNALEKQLAAQQALHDEARKWMAADKADLAKYGAEYDENGTISNYETVMEHIIDEYNSAIERYNNSEQGDGDKLALEAAEQIFEDAKKAIENYEEALSVANDSANEMLEIQNKLSEIEVEKIVYELELKIDLNERDLELLKYYQDKYTEELDKQDEIYNTILGSMLEYEDNLKALGEAYEELNNKRALGLITEADYAEAVQDLQDQIIDNLSELNNIQNQLVDTYTETLALAREEVERTTNTIDSANTALQSYMEILALSGNEKDYEKMATFYEIMNENNLTKIEIQRDHLNALLEEEDKFQEKIRSGQQLTDLEKKQYQALQEEIFETRDVLLSTTQEALGTIRETYENTINSISDNLDNFMADAAGSMAYLQEQYGYFQEEQERYVSTAKELYEVSKLNRDIEKTLGETTSKAAKEALKALQEKINKQSELNELTEYDIEMNQLQYQLLLARIKLEETQNAKDVVRLTRDENGNYAYRYTANQDKIDEAAQNYEDVLQQINDSTVQRTSEIEQQLLNTMSNYKEKFQEIATDYTLTEEERLMKLEELNNNFAETMQFIQEQNAIATENLTANQEAIAEHYGVNMSQITASTAGNVNETIQSMIDKTQDYINAMNEAIFGEEGGQTAWQKYLAGVGDITDAADVAYGTMIKDAEEMGEMNNWSAEQAQEVIDTLTDTLEPLEALTNAWNSHNAILEATISNYESLAEVIQGVLAAVGEIPNTTGTGEADGTSMPRFAKGGPVDYTGLAWVDGTPGNPEYVLNPGDTENILMAAATVKSMDSGFLGSLVESVKSAAHAMMNIFSNAYHAVGGVHTASTTLDQNVHITAEFPNVTDHNEIEEALLSLTNRASQFANQKK